MARRTYSRLTADEWQERLDREMARVLSAPASFPPATVQWARWRGEWLAASGSLFHQPVARAEVAEGEGLAGPSCGPGPPKDFLARGAAGRRIAQIR